MRRRRQVQSVCLVLFGIVALLIGVARLVPRLGVLAGWQTAEATMQRIEVVNSHDGDGYGTFRLSGSYQVAANGTNTDLTCTDGEWSTDFASVTARSNQLRGQLTRKVHYTNGACELAAADRLSYLGPWLLAIFIGLVLSGLGVYVWRLSRRALERCTACGSILRSYYRYCPECAATIQNKKHPIAV